MPFSTDNSWPAGLLNIFEICRKVNSPLENRYYGPYDKLINYCFGDSFTFFVAPQHPPDNATKESIDFIVFLVVFDTLRRPVLIAEVKDDSWASNPGLRLEADEQLRRRYNIMLSDCPLPRLWGLSLLGTSVRVYCGDVAARVITPPYQARPHQDFVVPSGFLQGGWDLDILSQEGFNKMKEIVADITAATAAL
jgi:hypothetical protein